MVVEQGPGAREADPADLHFHDKLQVGAALNPAGCRGGAGPAAGPVHPTLPQVDCVVLPRCWAWCLVGLLASTPRCCWPTHPRTLCGLHSCCCSSPFP